MSATLSPRAASAQTLAFPTQIFDAFDRMFAQTPSVNYPPHNILRLDKHQYRIELAVAGFAEDELSISFEDGQIVVEGVANPEIEREKSVYLHRGIARRSFKHSFTIHDTMKVVGATLKDGLLSIEVEQEIPEEAKPRKIEISRAE